MLHLLGQAFQNAQEPKPNARYLCSCLLLYHCATHSPKEKVPKPTMQSDSTGFFWYVLCNARSEEHTSELQSLMRISYAVFCLKKKKQHENHKQVHFVITSQPYT